MYPGLRGAALGEVPTSGTVLRIMLYVHLKVPLEGKYVCINTFYKYDSIKETRQKKCLEFSET